MFPYLDLAGFKIRTNIPDDFVSEFETFWPGWIAQNIATVSGLINARMRKRYGASVQGNSLPFGQQPPILLGAGTTPPSVTLVGRPTLGSLEILIQLLTPGALGVATFQWAGDNGRSKSFTGPLTTGPSVSLAGTGMQAVFSGVTAYSADNVYSASTPVPETVLRWLVSIVSWNAMCRRFRNSQDPALVTFKDEYDLALAEMREAADSKDGLFDLPASEDADTAITTGFPMSYTEASPYVWADVQHDVGRCEDHSRSGSST